MKYVLVADDGQARVVVAESKFIGRIRDEAKFVSQNGPRLISTAKYDICRREPSANGDHLVTIETWEKGQKV